MRAILEKTMLFWIRWRLRSDGSIPKSPWIKLTRELVEELRRAEFDGDFVSPVLASASKAAPYHLFWDDIDKLKMTDFKTEVLFDLVDSLYRQKHGLTVTGNYSMRDLVEQERMHPAIVRRLDDMCRVIEV